MEKELLKKLMADVGFETTETRNSDSLDFRDCFVGSVRDALEKAHEAGKRPSIKTGADFENAIFALIEAAGLTHESKAAHALIFTGYEAAKSAFKGYR